MTKRITELATASTTDGTEVLPVVQGGTTKKSTIAALIPPGTFVKSAIVTATDASTITFDLAAGSRQRVTIGGNRTLAITGDSLNPIFTITFNSGSGSRVLTWWAGITWAGGSAMVLSTDPNVEDTVVFERRGSGDYVGRIIDQGVPGPAGSPTVPGAPTIGTATTGNAQATANWTTPGSNGGASITGYQVTTYKASDNSVLFTDTLGVVLTFLRTGLTNGVGVYFKVAAINSVGTGAQSAASNTVTPSGATQILTTAQQGFESAGANGWLVFSNTSIAATPAEHHSGSQSLAVTATASGQVGVEPDLSGFTPTVGKTYTASVWWKEATPSHSGTITIYNQAFTQIATANLGDTANVWQQTTVSGVAPSGTTGLRVIVSAFGMAASEVSWLDDASVTET